jgi:hypothetical protein
MRPTSGGSGSKALYAFHDPTAEERAQHVYGAVAAVLALHTGAG